MTEGSVWDVDVYLHARSDKEVPTPFVEGKVRICVYDDGDWTAVVKNDDASFSLILRGGPESRTETTLRHLFGHLFGRAA